MLSLYTVALLTVIAGVSTATPAPIGTAILAEREPFLPEGRIAGHISCVELDSGRVWKVSSNFNAYGAYRRTDGDDLLRVRINLVAATTESVNINSLSALQSWDFLETGLYMKTRPYVGGISTEKIQRPSIGPKVFMAVLGATEATGLGALPSGIPSSVGNYGPRTNLEPYLAESAIWRYEPETSQLQPQWVHANGSTLHARVFYDTHYDEFVFMDSLAPVGRNSSYRGCNITFIPI